jgi:two-component system NtrC family response regulator
MEKLLIVEDNEEISKQLKWGLGKQYNVLIAGDIKQAMTLLTKHQPKVVTLDLGLPPDADGTEEGFSCLDGILKTLPYTKVIVITGNEDKESSLRAIDKGAYDFYQKPVSLEEIKVIIGRAFHIAGIEEENRMLRDRLKGKAVGMHDLVGQCPEMLEVFSTIRKVASSDVPVLIQGESGTGKELVARAIHLSSLRREGTFAPINCGAIPESLIESELFGHEKGAFTGAHMQIKGKLEYADKGTLFLDEIGELPSQLQVKLLRFLQEKSFQRVGGREDIHVDARIITATNIDISRAITENKFREDLYYRIGVITINLPPLRNRKGDILLLANLFLARFREQFGKKIKSFSAAAIGLLESSDWPGNVRELENKIQRAVIMSESPILEPRDLGFAENQEMQMTAPDDALTLKEAKDKVERDMIIFAMNKHQNNVAKAAEELQVSRPTMYDLMKKHALFCDSMALRAK